LTKGAGFLVGGGDLLLVELLLLFGWFGKLLVLIVEVFEQFRNEKILLPEDMVRVRPRAADVGGLAVVLAFSMEMLFLRAGPLDNVRA
jgi:hypothetical protein